MKYLLRASALYYGLSISELKSLAYGFAKKIGVEYPSSWDVNHQASNDWYYAFMHRRPTLALRTPEQISANRAKAFSEENVNSFFANLGSVLSEQNFEPHRIWNVDETGSPTVPTKVVRVLAKKGARRVGQKTSAERGTNVSLAAAVSATGQTIPSFYIFPRKNMQKNFMENAAPGSVGVATDSGWMNAEIFVKYMAHFIKHAAATKESPILLLLDNHTSHLSVEAINMAVEHGISMVSFPPHCSHRIQPLDVSVFGPFKNMYHTQCQAWMKNHIGRVLEIHHVPEIADKCLDATATPRNIKSGFRATGIFPFDPNVFTAEDFLAADLSGENQCSDDDNDANPDSRRVIVVSADSIDLAAHEEVTTSTSEMASTSSMPSTSGASLRTILREVGPLQHVTPAKKSNRGRRPMKSTILTSPENVAALKEKAQKKRISDEKNKQKAEGQSKRRRRTVTKEIQADDDEEEFCIICKGSMPKKLTKLNCVHCNECDRPVHLKCANVSAGGYTCIHCESE